MTAAWAERGDARRAVLDVDVKDGLAAMSPEDRQRLVTFLESL